MCARKSSRINPMNDVAWTACPSILGFFYGGRFFLFSLVSVLLLAHVKGLT